MTEKFYCVYFDKFDLEVNEDGVLQNPDVLQIIEFEYDEETDDVVAVRRVDENGNVLEEEWKDFDYVDDLDHASYDDDPTIREALNSFYQWLEENLEWRVSRRQTYWNPAEYICVGVTGCVDEEPRYHKRKHRWS